METFPDIPLAAWADTKATLHRFEQIVGKVRLAASVRRNHWWNVPFHVTGRGITTRPMGGLGDLPVFAIDFDFVGHRLTIDVIDGRSVSFSLPGLSVAAFYRELFAALDHLGIHVAIKAEPFDLDDDVPFPKDTGHAAYDPVDGHPVLAGPRAGRAGAGGRYAADFSGKTGPVHHFWHTFDIAVTRFSGRKVEQAPTSTRSPARPTPRGDQRRLLVRRPELARTGLLLLHRARARRPHRGAAPPR